MKVLYRRLLDIPCSAAVTGKDCPANNPGCSKIAHKRVELSELGEHEAWKLHIAVWPNCCDEDILAKESSLTWFEHAETAIEAAVAAAKSAPRV